MFCDNHAATCKVSNPVFHEQTKDIDFESQFVQDRVMRKRTASSNV